MSVLFLVSSSHHLRNKDFLAFLIWMTDKQNLAHLANWDKLQCMAGGDQKSQARFGQLLKDITSERLCNSSLGMVIAIPSAIIGFILLICCIVCVKRMVFSETKEIEEFERNEGIGFLQNNFSFVVKFFKTFQSGPCSS